MHSIVFLQTSWNNHLYVPVWGHFVRGHFIKYTLFLFFLIILPAGFTYTQALTDQTFTRYDSLRGTLTPLRTCYDVTYYDLNLRIDPATQSIKGHNIIHYKTTAPFTKLQIDLFSNMHISRIEHQGKELQFERDSNFVFVTFPQEQKQAITDAITVHYEGKPLIALNPPWDGGFSWEKDETGKDWVGVSCEGIGASLWWPNKDHLSDEPDSMRMSYEVPSHLMCVANGSLRRKTPLNDGFTRYDWHVSYPINNYNVTLNIADYTHFSDTYTARDGEKLALDYYVLRYNLEKAKKHFEQVKPMLACYEKFFGKYPFWKDGYALVETPYLGMEHQSAIAYGNNYQQGYDGGDISGSGVGMKFDYLIIHESGHEYWGNSVSAHDHGEMWIHESFCTYAEALYVECLFGYDNALRYLAGQAQSIANQEPILGPPDVNYTGWSASDMYFKGSLMLHTLRNVINNDKLWFEIIYGIAQEFKMKVTSTDAIVQYINKKTGKDYTYFFNQYLKYPQIPVFQYTIVQQGKKPVLQYRWNANVENFQMPVKADLGNGKYETLTPTYDWKTIPLKGNKKNFRLATELFYILVQQVGAEKTKS